MEKLRLEDRVLKYMQENGSITSWEAIKEFGATRLSAIIFNLRKDYKNKTKIKTDVNRYGDKVHYGQYIYGGKYGE